MSVSTTIKQALKAKIQALSSVEEVYGHEEINPKGWPIVVVTAGDMDGEFASNSQNSRTYSFNCRILFPTGQDFVQNSEMNRLEYAEQVVATVIDQIINDMDTDFELDGTPEVLYMNAADAVWEYVTYEGGEARSAVITLNIYTELTVT